MTDLIDHIDEQIKTCIGAGIKTFGLCHLIEDDNGVYPATVGKEGIKVAPDNNFNVLIYHRLLNGSIEPREDLSFGRKVTGQTNQRMRMVVFIDISEQALIDDIINALPDVFEIDDYQYCNVSGSIDLIRDSVAVWSEEFSEAYKSRFQKRFHVYAVEYTLEYIKCPVCETS